MAPFTKFQMSKFQMSSIFLSGKCFGGNSNTNILSQSQNVLEEKTAKGNSFGDPSECVAFLLKFLLGHTAPVGYETGP